MNRRCADCGYLGPAADFMAVGVDTLDQVYFVGLSSESPETLPVCVECVERLAALPWGWLLGAVLSILDDALPVPYEVVHGSTSRLGPNAPAAS